MRSISCLANAVKLSKQDGMELGWRLKGESRLIKMTGYLVSQVREQTWAKNVAVVVLNSGDRFPYPSIHSPTLLQNLKMNFQCQSCLLTPWPDCRCRTRSTEPKGGSKITVICPDNRTCMVPSLRACLASKAQFIFLSSLFLFEIVNTSILSSLFNQIDSCCSFTKKFGLQQWIAIRRLQPSQFLFQPSIFQVIFKYQNKVRAASPFLPSFLNA